MLLTLKKEDKMNIDMNHIIAIKQPKRSHTNSLWYFVEYNNGQKWVKEYFMDITKACDFVQQVKQAYLQYTR